MKLALATDRWELNEPFVTAQESLTHIETITVGLRQDGFTGRGEALGVDYLDEDAGSMREQVEAIRTDIEHGIDRHSLQSLLPCGGARNALDCALWDLEAKRRGKRAWELLEAQVRPVTTVYTLSLDDPGRMAAEAQRRREFPVLKLKLDQDGAAERLAAVRTARPDAELVIDANGSWTPSGLETLADELLLARVNMLEQPLPAGSDEHLRNVDYPVMLCADESCQDSADLEHMVGRYDMVNIKLDKCGGLSEALQMVRWCEDHGLALMVGNMLGSSLAMAPGFIVAQSCRYVDLDGPLWQKTDRATPIQYLGAAMHAPERELWG